MCLKQLQCVGFKKLCLFNIKVTHILTMGLKVAPLSYCFRGAFTVAVVGSLVAARHHVNKRRAEQEASGVRSPYKLSWEERLQVEEYRAQMEAQEREGHSKRNQSN